MTASSPTGDTAAAAEAPDVWWWTSRGAVLLPVDGTDRHGREAQSYDFWNGDDWDSLDALPADAVRLVPAVSSSSPDDTAPPGPVSRASGEPYGPGTVVDVIAEELNETVGMTVSWPRISSTAHRAAARLRKLGLLAGAVPVPADGDTEEPKR